MNIPGADSIVEEYLIHRGFTKTFRHLQNEKREDRTKGFSATRIVEQIFYYIHNFEMENFINLWDFLSKRFFMHLDQEHILLLSKVKSDLIKFYLVNAIKKNQKDKVTDFFTKYSHEIITESGDSCTGLRSWYVLPYMEEPEKDPEFMVYFTVRWSEMLRVTLNNFLSMILLNSPPPKLLLLERWFRSEAQQEMRMQLKQASENVESLLARLKSYEDRLITLHGAVKDLAMQLHHHHSHITVTDATEAVRRRRTPSVGLFETDEDADKKREEVRNLGQAVCRLAAECVQKRGTPAQSVGVTTGNRSGSRVSDGKRSVAEMNTEEMEIQLMLQLQEWLKALSV